MAYRSLLRKVTILGQQKARSALPEIVAAAAYRGKIEVQPSAREIESSLALQQLSRVQPRRRDVEYLAHKTDEKSPHGIIKIIQS